MPFIRAIGRWTMTALVINCIIGGGIFGLPSELIRLLGRSSPIAMIVAAIMMSVIAACFAEVASQFSDPGGAYLYVRTAFGRFAGIQVGWFSLLALIATGATMARLFVAHLAAILPWLGRSWAQVSVMTVMIAIPAIANYLGVRSGANLSNFLTVTKLLPLGVLLALGLLNFSRHPQVIRIAEITSPGFAAWLNALLLLLFLYGGWQDALIPLGEVKEPHRTVPLSLGAGLLVASVIYILVQFIVVATIGTGGTNRPLAATAAVFMGQGGALFVSLAVMISTYGWLSGNVVNAPRLLYSLSAKDDFPKFFSSLHARYNSPARAIVVYALSEWLFAVSGTYLWLVVLAAGSNAIFYAGVCAALVKLRRLNPNAKVLRLPLGPVFSAIGITISLLLLTRLDRRQSFLLGVTAVLATANWWLAKRRDAGKQRRPAPETVAGASAE
jgi:basic amino acid/polyamine antiporter, APA family